MTSESARPTNATVLGHLYDETLVLARAAAWECGYALARHGSELRDLDLLAAPWTDEAEPADVLALRIRDAVHGAFTAGDPAHKPQGRLAWSITLSHPTALGDAMAASSMHSHPHIDLSVMPRAESTAEVAALRDALTDLHDKARAFEESIHAPVMDAAAVAKVNRAQRSLDESRIAARRVLSAGTDQAAPVGETGGPR